MKKLSLLSFVALAARSLNGKKTMKTLFATILLACLSQAGFAQVTVFSAFDGTGICPNTAVGGSAPAYTALTDFFIEENSTGDFSAGTNTLTLSAPAGWQFNPSSTLTYGFSNPDITSATTTSISSSSITITIVCSGTTNFDGLDVSGIQVQATSTSSTPAYIYASTTAGITGIVTGTSGTDFGDLSLASPVAPSVTIAASPTGSVCSGSGITFTPTPTNGGTPSYQWFINGTLVASGSPFATSTLNNGDLVDAVMTSTASCVTPSTATSNTITASILPLPTTVTVSGGGTFCGSTTVTATNGGSGTIYFQGTTSNGTSTGTPGGTQTISSSGTYYFRAQSAGGCWGTQGSVTVVINPLPTAVTVTGGGTYCVGSAILSASNGGSGTIYFEGTTSNGTSTATPATTESITSSGTYYFRAQSSAGCWSTQGSAVISINTPPTAFTVTGGGAYCSGGTGVPVGLSGSQSGVNYQLFNGSTGLGIVPGTGSAITFGSITAAATYTVTATNTTSGCTNGMTGSATVSINPLPTQYAVNGGGGYCIGGTGAVVGMANSDAGISYQLYNGSTATGSAIVSAGGAFNFGSETAVGTYTVNATNPSTGCTNPMTGSVAVFTNPLPAAFVVTGGGGYCAGGTGVHVGLFSSVAGTNYQLFNGATALGIMAGTGGSIDFGLETVAGTYTVVATTTATSCTNNMTGSAIVVINPLPNAYTVTGGGGYCTGGTGVHVGLSGSDAGVSYQLYNGGTAVGSVIAGTGSAIDFGLQSSAGASYTVTAVNTTTGCTANMTGSVAVVINPLPTPFTVGGGGSYCLGGTGMNITLSSSTIGVNYQLAYLGSPIGAPVAGSGALLTFGPETGAGAYTISATDGTTGCANNMTGSAAIVISPLPNIYTVSVTGGGSYCAGGTGVDITLGGSDAGINYRLIRNGAFLVNTLAGTGFGLDYGLTTTVGAYTVTAINATTGCTSNMSGTATVTTNPLPTAYAVTGGGTICSGSTGVAVDLTGSTTGIGYQLMLNGFALSTPVTGTGSGITFGLETVAGTYTAVATDPVTGCTNNMIGNATVSVNITPTAFAVTGGGNYCSGTAGVVIGISGSATGVNYELMNGVTIESTLPGTGSAISFPAQTTPGSYTVVGTNAISGCFAAMSGSATVSVNPLPGAFAMAGGGSYCSGGTGVDVSLAGSATGINYQLYKNGAVSGGIMAGTGSAIDFGMETVAGTYTVIATDAVTACTVNMTGSSIVSINPLPTAFTVTGGGSYCSGGTGVHVGLSGSASGISYQMYISFTASGAAVPGTGSALDFGLQTTDGFYTVIATDNTTLCTNDMISGVTVVPLPLPTAHTVTGGGHYCAGGAGVHVGLDGTDAGVNYQLYRGATLVGSSIAGTGGAIDFGLETVAGTYTVVATDGSTLCTNNMTGEAVVVIDALPLFYTVGGGGLYCAGGTGVDVNLSGSDLTINYQTLVNGSIVGSPVAGTGSLLDFGLETTTGTYTVVATNTITGCVNLMTGSVTVSTNPLPIAYTLTGGGAYCSGGAGEDISLSNSETGLSYQLFNGASTSGTALTGTTGSSLDFGFELAAGTYTVVATNPATGCTNNMANSVGVTVNALPSAYTVGGGGNYCAGGTGVHVTLTGSDLPISYQIFVNGVSTGSAALGTGTPPLDFGLETTTGTYTVVATNTVTGCVNNMTGSVTVSTNPLPGAFTVTGGGSYCAGGTGVHVGLSGSVAGINYQLFDDGSVSGVASAGSGAAIDFGLKTTGGTYTVVATNGTTGCTSNMTGSVGITVNPLPSVSAITGRDSVCFAGTTTLSDATTGGVWTSSDITTSTVGSSSGVVAGIAAGTVTITYTFTNGSGCSAFVTYTMPVLPAPAVGIVTGPNTVCAGASITLGDGTTGGVWSSSDTTIATVDGTGAVTGVAIGGANISYTFTDVNGCAASAPYAITVGAGIPASSVLPGASATLCHGNPVNLSVSPTATGVTYQWFVDGTAISGAFSSTYTATTAGDYTVVLNNGTCTETLSGTEVLPTPNPVITLDTVANLLFAGPYVTFQWYLNGAAIPGATDNNVMMTAPAGSIYTVVVGDVNGCSDSSGVYIVPGTVSGVANVMTAGSIRIYPNPASSVLHIDAPGKVYVSVISADGKVLIDHDEAVSLNVSNIADGVYLIMVYDKDNILVKTDKFVKMQ